MSANSLSRRMIKTALTPVVNKRGHHYADRQLIPTPVEAGVEDWIFLPDERRIQVASLL